MKHQSYEWSLRNERQKWNECFWRGGTKRIAFLPLMIREIPASLYCTESQSINGKEIIYDTGEKWTKFWDNILEYNIRGRIDGIWCPRECTTFCLCLFFFLIKHSFLFMLLCSPSSMHRIFPTFVFEELVFFQNQH